MTGLQPLDNGLSSWVVQGAEGWKEWRRVGSAWVNISVMDVNDNTPSISKDHAHRTVPEDTPPGTLLAAFPATDADGVSHYAGRQPRCVAAPNNDLHELLDVVALLQPSLPSTPMEWVTTPTGSLGVLQRPITIYIKLWTETTRCCNFTTFERR